MKHLDLFSGIGGFALAARWVGWETVGFCEIDPYCQKVLRKHWPDVPIHQDIRELCGYPGAADIVTGGWPCQDISVAGKREGIRGKRSGLWGELARVIGEIRPRFAVLENVSNVLLGGSGGWFSVVLSDLAEIGYDAEWHCIPASYLGAPHHRDRVWIIADRDGERRNGPSSYFERADVVYQRSQWPAEASGEWRNVVDWLESPNADAIWEATDRENVRMDDGVSRGLDRDDIKAIGNSIVPQCAELVFRRIEEIA